MKTCQYCEKPLFEVNAEGFRTQRLDSTFCSEACRNGFHNRQKKISRAKSRAVAAIKTLVDINTPEAHEAIRQISKHAQAL